MASILVSDLVGDVRGSVGSVTLTGTRGGVSLQSRSRGCVRDRKRAAGVSGAFSDASVAWGALAPAVQRAWTREAGGEGLGYSRFVSVMTHRRLWGDRYDFTVPISMDLPSPGVVTLAISVAAVTFDIGWTGTPFPGLYTAVVRLCVFPSPGARTAPGGWVATVSAGDAWSGGVDVGMIMFSFTEIFVPGRSVGVEVAFWCSRSGRLSGYIPARCIVAA